MITTSYISRLKILFTLHEHRGSTTMARKNGPLGVADKFFIENHLDNIDECAKALNRPKGIIKTYVAEFRKKNPDVDKAETAKEEVFNARKIMAKHAGGSVMTAAAAEFGDELRKKTIVTKGRGQASRPSAIAKIYPDEK